MNACWPVPECYRQCAVLACMRDIRAGRQGPSAPHVPDWWEAGAAAHTFGRRKQPWSGLLGAPEAVRTVKGMSRISGRRMAQQLLPRPARSGMTELRSCITLRVPRVANFIRYLYRPQPPTASSTCVPPIPIHLPLLPQLPLATSSLYNHRLTYLLPHPLLLTTTPPTHHDGSRRRFRPHRPRCKSRSTAKTIKKLYS